MLFALAGSAQTNATLGGAGVCNVDQDPDGITDMQTQDERYECLFAWDEDNQVFYVYDGAGGANKWLDYSTLLPQVTNTNHRLDAPSVSGGNLTFNIIDVANGNAILGTETVSILSIAPIQDVTAGSGIGVSIDGSGNATITNNAQEATTVTDGNSVDFTKIGDDITAEVILDPAGDNALTTSGAGLKVVVPAKGDNSSTNEIQALTRTGSDATLSLGGGTISINDADFDPTNENQTVSAGDGVIVTQVGQDFEVTNTESSKGAFKNHAGAAAGSVALGDYFHASTDNTMGVPAGTKIKRMF